MQCSVTRARPQGAILDLSFSLPTSSQLSSTSYRSLKSILLSVPTVPSPAQPFNSRRVDFGYGVQKWYLVPHNQQRIRSWHLPRPRIRTPLQCPGACQSQCQCPGFSAIQLLAPGSLPTSSLTPPWVHAIATFATVCKVFAKRPSLCPTACCLALSSRLTHSIARS